MNKYFYYLKKITFTNFLFRSLGSAVFLTCIYKFYKLVMEETFCNEHQGLKSN